MCGIIGWIGFEPAPLVVGLELLRHRGPDDQGQAAYRSRSGRVAAVLGSTRLSIIDLSAAGHMPMEHPEEPLALIYNGEVYNFSELRRELESAGERFFSRTDTEVILRGYRVWGDGIIPRLRGMFAFALWDGRGDGRLLLARDRFGKKPLYFQGGGHGGLWFSSELKTLLAGDQPRRIDAESLEYFLDRGYPPPDRCLLQGFKKLLPGHALVWEQGQVRQYQYWRLPEADPDLAALSPEQVQEGFKGRLIDAVQSRLVADVPIGLLLSGGVDSSSLLALMTRRVSTPVNTYTACFGTVDLDESEKARQTSLTLGSQHHAIMINPRAGMLLPFIASHMDEPLADPSAIATYLICRRAREEVTVLLTGDGSDELLLGYPRYRLHAAAQVMSRTIPLAVRRQVLRFLPAWSLLGRTLAAPEDPLLRDRFWLDHARRRVGAFARAGVRLSMEQAVRQVLEEDIRSWLVEDILMKVDKMSMAASMEIRVPFLDQVLAEWAISLPTRARMSWRRGKLPLYKAMRGLLPGHISWSKKQPFHLPIDDWLGSEWRILAQDVLLDSRTQQRGWLDGRQVQRILKEHLAGARFHGRRLYQLLILELWARAILDRGEAEPIPPRVDDCSRELLADRRVRRVAVIAPAGIGDTMRLTPALKQLGVTDPNVSVTLYVAADRGSDEVMAGLPPVDRHVLIDFHGTGVRRFVQLIADLRRNLPDQIASTWISKFSGLVGLLSGAKSLNGWVPVWSPAMRLNRLFWKNRVSYDPCQRGAGSYDTLAFGRILGLESLENLAPGFAPPIWEERALFRAREEIGNLPRPVLMVNAVAQPSIRQREYPLDLLAAALEGLLAERLVNSIVLLGDHLSRAAHGDLIKSLGFRVLDLSGRLSLTGTAAVLREGDAVLTIDGGLLHVALATALPVLVLYGPTEIYPTDPRGIPGRYIMLSAFGACRCLCLNHRGIQVKKECQDRAQCLAAISPERLVASCRALLNRPGSPRSAATDSACQARRVAVS